MDTQLETILYPILKNLGIDPEAIGKSKLKKLVQILNSVDPNSETDPNIDEQIQRLLGLPTKPRPKEVKIGRNEPCLCESGKKWKKCCGSNTK